MLSNTSAAELGMFLYVCARCSTDRVRHPQSVHSGAAPLLFTVIIICRGCLKKWESEMFLLPALVCLAALL